MILKLAPEAILCVRVSSQCTWGAGKKYQQHNFMGVQDILTEVYKLIILHGKFRI